ncbi:MAG TPA: GxxExxY protein [Bacteroidia bacterium]|nr:GxxExxY protein [Bacteroidia bacterium]
MSTQEINELSRKVIGCCIEVHRTVGPGLLEKFYERSLLRELALNGISANSQVPIPALYKGEPVGHAYYADILVEGEIVLEIKAAEEMHPIFEAQLLSYLKLSNKRLGLVVNFNMPRAVTGIRRVVNQL